MLKQVSGLKGKNYQERLKEVGLETLADRRAKKDLIQVFRVVKGIDNVEKGLWFTEFQQSGDCPITRNAAGVHNFIKPKARLDVRLNFWSNRVVNAWNSLPSEIKLRSSISSFKVALDAYWEGNYKEPPKINNENH